MFKRLLATLADHPLATLLALAVGAFGVHALSVAAYPASWFDEIEILEMGRFSVFDVPPDWSVNLFPTTDGALHPPVPYFHYVSGMVMETLYRFFHTHVAHRLLMLLSLPCAAFALFGWLRAKGVAAGVALTVAALFLLDPNATICAHWYRPDLWCLCMTFCALTLIARKAPSFRPVFAAGALFATAGFFWITTIVLVPVVFTESVLCSLNAAAERKARAVARTMLAGCAGGLCAAAVWLVPLYAHVPAIVEQYLTHSEFATAGAQTAKSLADYAAAALYFVRIALRSPFPWLAAAVGILAARRFRWQAAVFLLSCAFVIATRVYHLRMIYLLPYLFLLTAGTLSAALDARAKFIRGCACLAAFGAASFAAALSLGALTVAALSQPNTLTDFTAKLAAAVPGDKPRVYLYDAEHELYYAGRALNWRMYSYAPRNLVFVPEKTADLVDHLDAVVVSRMLKDEDRPSVLQEQFLRDHGFAKTATVEMNTAIANPLRQKLAGVFYAHGYPSCDVWTKTHPNAGLQQ